MPVLRTLSCGMLVASLAVSSVPSAPALEWMHRTVRQGPLLCFADHIHRGEGRVSPTRDAAMADAIRSWRGLVVVEYGEPWGRFDLSAGAQAQCLPSSNARQPGWICRIASRPCRVG